MIQTKMRLTHEEIDILEGKQGETMKKIMETLVRYGDAFGAEQFVPIDRPAHLVGAYALIAIKPYTDFLVRLAEEGIKTKLPFTCNPRPLDYVNIDCTDEEKGMFDTIYADQERHEAALKKIGLMKDSAFTCTCYQEEVGNVPKYGDMLAWAESSAVVYANSVLGARTNRTSGIVDLFSAILGKTPQFGLLADDGRRADWIMEIKTDKLPHPQVLGSAVGMKALEQVPYIKGLDRFLGNELNNSVRDYLKDFGAATASNGAVGLYHVDNLTPEAKEHGESLIRSGAKTYIINDAELERVVEGYPLMWKDPTGTPEMAFIGCPHNSFSQLCQWTQNMEVELARQDKDKLEVYTLFAAAQDVIDKFKQSEYYPRFMATGAHLTYICPLMYLANPKTATKRVVTNSNKLRTYSFSRFVDDESILKIIVKGGMVL